MRNPKYPSGTGATAAIAGHPLHPMLVVLPITALIGAAVSDWVYLYTGGKVSRFHKFISRKSH